MNAHNEQHDSASPVVKQNLTTQPAAAQEAVATVDSFTNGSYHRNYKLRWHKNVDAGTQLFASPVTAAPADLISGVLSDLAAVAGSWIVEAAGPSADALNDCAAKMLEAIEQQSIKYGLFDASTPAAPGIDLPYSIDADPAGIRSLVADLITGTLMVGAQGHSPPPTGHWLEPFWLAARSDSTLIDASPKGATFPNDGNSEAQFIADGGRLNCPACGGSGHVEDSPKGGSDPWRGLYAPERAPNRDEYGCFYHPDIPSWDDEREESIAPLLKAQGFDLQCVPGDFSDEAMEEGGERYWQEMREWNPEPEGDGWRLVAIYDTEDGPYSMFVKPLAQAGDAEVQP